MSLLRFPLRISPFYRIVGAIGGGLLCFKLYLRMASGKCDKSTRLDGKTAIVTGANTGIGYEVAKDFASRGAKVILACRNMTKAEEAKNIIIKETGNNQVLAKFIDFASLKSVRTFAQDILATESKLNILVNNAGAAGLDNVKSEDGIQLGLQVNHFGPFLLTNLLLGRLKESAPSRVVVVSGIGYKFAKVDMEDINMEKSYRGTLVYCNSKLYNIHMANEIARKCKGTVIANSNHPGIVMTDILRNLPGWFRIPLHGLIKMFYKTAEEGAQTTIYLAVAPELSEVTGEYFVDCKKATMSEQAQDEELAKKIWEIGEDLVKLQPEERHY